MSCDILDIYSCFFFFSSLDMDSLNINERLTHTLSSSELSGDMVFLLQNNCQFSTSLSL